ncbi:hypothetical protein [Streptomyces sp. NPDC014006]
MINKEASILFCVRNVSFKDRSCPPLNVAAQRGNHGGCAAVGWRAA